MVNSEVTTQLAELLLTIVWGHHCPQGLRLRPPQVMIWLWNRFLLLGVRHVWQKSERFQCWDTSWHKPSEDSHQVSDASLGFRTKHVRDGRILGPERGVNNHFRAFTSPTTTLQGICMYLLGSTDDFWISPAMKWVTSESDCLLMFPDLNQKEKRFDMGESTISRMLGNTFQYGIVWHMYQAAVPALGKVLFCACDNAVSRLKSDGLEIQRSTVKRVFPNFTAICSGWSPPSPRSPRSLIHEGVASFTSQLRGWYDFFLEGALEDFQMAKQRGSQVPLLGVGWPWVALAAHPCRCVGLVFQQRTRISEVDISHTFR